MQQLGFYIYLKFYSRVKEFMNQKWRITELIYFIF